MTGLAVAIYQRREERKSTTIQYFREMVLTPDFFDVLRYDWYVCELLNSFEEVKMGKSDTVLINGVPVVCSGKDEDTITNELLRLAKLRFESMEKAMRSGAWFLLPESIRESMDFMPSPDEIMEEPAHEKRQELIEQYYDELGDIEDNIKKVLGLREL